VLKDPAGKMVMTCAACEGYAVDSTAVIHIMQSFCFDDPMCMLSVILLLLLLLQVSPAGGPRSGGGDPFGS
jgi:hypothetical protein